MATKKDSPANYDRWDTITGTTKRLNKNTPSQQRAVDQINAQRAKEKAEKKKK